MCVCINIYTYMYVHMFKYITCTTSMDRILKLCINSFSEVLTLNFWNFLTILQGKKKFQWGQTLPSWKLGQRINYTEGHKLNLHLRYKERDTHTENTEPWMKINRDRKTGRQSRELYNKDMFSGGFHKKSSRLYNVNILICFSYKNLWEFSNNAH